MHPLLVSRLDMPWSLRVESSGGGCLCGAVRCGTGKCDYCCGSATRLRVGDCAAVHSDGGPGAGCGDVCCDGACVLRFRCWFAHYPCSELRKPCITPIKASEQTTDLHRSLGTPQGWTTVQRGWSPPRCCCWRGYPMTMVLTVLFQYTPPSYLILFISSDSHHRPHGLTERFEARYS